MVFRIHYASGCKYRSFPAFLCCNSGVQFICALNANFAPALDKDSTTRIYPHMHMHNSFPACRANGCFITYPFCSSNNSTMLIKTDFFYGMCSKATKRKRKVTTASGLHSQLVENDSSVWKQWPAYAQAGWGIPHGFQSCHFSREYQSRRSAVGSALAGLRSAAACFLWRGVRLTPGACRTPGKCDLLPAGLF